MIGVIQHRIFITGAIVKLSPTLGIEFNDAQMERTTGSSLRILYQKILFPVLKQIKEYGRLSILKPFKHEDIVSVQTLQQMGRPG